MTGRRCLQCLPPPSQLCPLLLQVCSWKGAAEHRIKDQKVPYAFQSNQWVGFDDVESCKIKVRFSPAGKVWSCVGPRPVNNIQ